MRFKSKTTGVRPQTIGIESCPARTCKKGVDYYSQQSFCCENCHYVTERLCFTGEQPLITTTTAATRELCLNLHGSDRECEAWGESGHCEQNPGYMLVNCARACGACEQTTKSVIATTTTKRPPTTVAVTRTPPSPGKSLKEHSLGYTLYLAVNFYFIWWKCHNNHIMNCNSKLFV